MEQHKMKAIVATGYGSSDVLEFREVNKPEPKENEVLVKVVATTVNAADTMMLTGKPRLARLFIGLTKPKKPIPGTGFAGIIESVGSAVKFFKPGDRVFGETALNFSANAEYLAVEQNGIILPMPAEMKFEEASTFSYGHLTSLNFLKEIAEIKPGQHVLINGAAGSLGLSAVQLAKYFGAEVTGVCSGRNTGLVKSLGADHVIDYTREDFTKSDIQYDIVYDTVGKSSFSKAKNVLKEKGQYISPVMEMPLLFDVIRTSLFGKKKAKFAATGMKKHGDLRLMLNQLIEIFQEGKLQSVIDRQFPLEKVAEAHAYVTSGRKRGDVVINVLPQ